MKAELIECKGKSLEAVQEYIAELTSVVRDKQPKNSERLLDRLLTESVGGEASRVLEFVPCTILQKEINKDTTQQFGFTKGRKYYTNARELLNWGWKLKDVLTVVDFTHYKALKCETPYFLYGQLSTHNQLTTVSHSQRYSECDRGYWMPPEMKVCQDFWDVKVNSLSPEQLKDYMKENGIVRKEVWDRGRDMLQNRVFSIGGYINNPNAWEHFMKQRLDKHTQAETRQFVKSEIGKFILNKD